MRESLSTEDLARAACLSPRQFTRLFRSQTGTTPAKAVEALRIEAAKLMLEQSRLPIEVVGLRKPRAHAPGLHPCAWRGAQSDPQRSRQPRHALETGRQLSRILDISIDTTSGSSLKPPSGCRAKMRLLVGT
ncbi:helix-turn-helix domain-containing protein, partial [Inquilinus sp. 2KB_12]|uniref:helix-turn-helix domain-containing protein n=1 Tax=Inquilinus sp. 2KB_12 TaxID=3232975 RepID=UPI003F921343